jgi:amino acid transporter
MDSQPKSNSVKFGTAPVFFTAISTILGAILFLRFGFAVGSIGFFGVFLIILLGHLVTIPTALAISELATNSRVEGGGEYFIISRSFGLNIGAAIGIALYLSQTISVAFYTIAFAEAFSPLFEYAKTQFDLDLPKQVISIPAILGLSVLIIKKGADLGVKTLYVVVGILGISLLLFFMGSTEFASTTDLSLFDKSFRNSDQFFIVFAIVFPAFTGMTAGVGLSGDLKDPAKSIPLGSISATLAGMIIYILVIWKLSSSASPEDLLGDQLIMSKIAIWGAFVIPIGLAASTISSAIGSVLVAPRTLQAIGTDNSFPVKKLNSFFSKGRGKLNEPFNATILSCIIAFVFVALGDVNAVAEIISMFFMVTYGSICLISFLYHFGSDPSYRPTFRSKWYFSLIGFLICLWLMFQMNPLYAIVSIILMTLMYLGINYYHKSRRGLEAIFQGFIFQLSRRIQVYLQKTRKLRSSWRPSAVCITESLYERNKAFELMNWISYKHGFGTYFHYIKGYYSKASNVEAKKVLDDLISKTDRNNSNMYIDTIISPSYTSAIAQILQFSSPSGMENNLILFEFDKSKPENLGQIIENVALTQAGEYDVCILGCSTRNIKYENGIHIWIRNLENDNANLMILLGYIILGHSDWQKGMLKIFNICSKEDYEEQKKKMADLVVSGRLPITEKNISVLIKDENKSFKAEVNEYSRDAALTMIEFREEQIKHEGEKVFLEYDNVGDILFVDSCGIKELN